LLHLPTVGTSKLDVGDLSLEHMKRLKDIFEGGNARFIFIPSMTIGLMRKTKLFPWLHSKPLRTDNDLEVLYENSSRGQVIYQMYHLSCYGWQEAKLSRQVVQVREMVANLRGTSTRLEAST
jgi:hypothetical protein